MQPPPNEVTAMSFEGARAGGKSPQNNNKTQTNKKPHNNKTALPGCSSAEILKLQPVDITVVFRFHLFKDHPEFDTRFSPGQTHSDSFLLIPDRKSDIYALR